MADWELIKEEWIAGSDDVTHVFLAAKHRVRRGTVNKRAEREGWMKMRVERRRRIATEFREAAVERQLNTMQQIHDENVRIYKQLKDKAEMDVSGVYPPGVKPKGQILKCADLLAIMRDERKLYEYIYGEEGVPDEVHKVGLKVVGFDLTKLLGK